jgi:hypothetical protein
MAVTDIEGLGSRKILSVLPQRLFGSLNISRKLGRIGSQHRLSKASRQMSRGKQN